LQGVLSPSANVLTRAIHAHKQGSPSSFRRRKLSKRPLVISASARSGDWRGAWSRRTVCLWTGDLHLRSGISSAQRAWSHVVHARERRLPTRRFRSPITFAMRRHPTPGRRTAARRFRGDGSESSVFRAPTGRGIGLHRSAPPRLVSAAPTWLRGSVQAQFSGVDGCTNPEWFEPYTSPGRRLTASIGFDAASCRCPHGPTFIWCENREDTTSSSQLHSRRVLPRLVLQSGPVNDLLPGQVCRQQIFASAVPIRKGRYSITATTTSPWTALTGATIRYGEWTPVARNARHRRRPHVLHDPPRPLGLRGVALPSPSFLALRPRLLRSHILRSYGVLKELCITNVRSITPSTGLRAGARGDLPP